MINVELYVMQNDDKWNKNMIYPEDFWSRHRRAHHPVESVST